MGIQRSLTSDEILAQMYFAKKICRLYHLPDVTNVVFMGKWGTMLACLHGRKMKNYSFMYSYLALSC